MSSRSLFILSWLCLALLLAPVSEARQAIQSDPTPQAPTATTHGTLTTNEGPSIYDYELALLLDLFVPESNAHSRLLIFTECYGGDKLDDFSPSSTKTTVLSANGAGKSSYYGGYHDDAAEGLRPEAGRTSADVHADGTAGKHKLENPQSQGPDASLEPVDPVDGPIKSRHVLVYAGKPNAQDDADRDAIENNFAGEPNTTVTTVGSDGTGGWDHPGTMAGLISALANISLMMNPDEQFILFVTDHGDHDVLDSSPVCDGTGNCSSEPLALPEPVYQDMLLDSFNQPEITLVSELPPSELLTVSIADSGGFVVDSFFDIAVYSEDYDNDGSPDVYKAVLPIPEPLLDPLGLTVHVGSPDAAYTPQIGLGSGDIAKVGSQSHGTLATNEGPSIYDFQLKRMLDQFIPENNAHSRLLVFTECYGGDKLDEFANDAKTTVLSATSPGEPAYYGGYHDDAAEALGPGDGKTSDDVHQAGVDGKDAAENPQQQGPGASLEHTDPTDGPIKSRHVLVYAGQPNAQDEADRQAIEDNFAGEANTTVTTVGSDGTGDWDHPGTQAGLAAALKTISDMMSSEEQFILFVTDHGNHDAVDAAPDCDDAGTTCDSAPLAFSEGVYEDMWSDPGNQPHLTFFNPGSLPFEGTVFVQIIGGPGIGEVTGSQPVDLNDDGDTDDPGEGWETRLPVPEELLDPAGTAFRLTEVGTSTSAPTAVTALAPAYISLESGNIPKCSAPQGPIPSAALDNGHLQLSWSPVPGALSFNIYRDSAPYFSPSGTYSNTVDISWTDTAGTTGDVAVHSFYVVQTANACGISVETHRLGEFEFALAPGTVDAAE